MNTIRTCLLAIVFCCVLYQVFAQDITFEDDTRPKRKSAQKCQEYGIEIDEMLKGKCNHDVAIPLIIGGGAINAAPKEFPHVVLLGFQGLEEDNFKTIYACGGTLISKKIVIAAAHCLNTRQYGPPISVIVGSLLLNPKKDDKNIQEVKISKTYKHPDYKPPSKYNDIGLIELEKEVTFTPYAYPACLSQNKDIDANRIVTSTDWEASIDGKQNDILLKINVRVIPNANCSMVYEPTRMLRDGISKNHVCAGIDGGSRDNCYGSTGGTIQSPSKQHCMYDIFGISSFGKSCIWTIPEVFTRIYPYMDWIESIVWP